MNKINFTEMSPGVWCGKTAENVENTGIMRFVREPDFEAVGRNFSPVKFPFDEVFTETVCGKTVVCVPFDKKERLYGLGLGYKKIAKNYDVVHLRCDHYGGRDDGRTHVPTPFYVSDRGYGVFIDTSEHISFYMGGTVRTDAKNPPKEQNRGRDEDWSSTTIGEFVEASFENAANIYIFAGETMLEVVSRFNLFCGGGAIVPKWGLGFWHRVHLNFGEKEVFDEIKAFKEQNFDLDVIGLEPGWHSNSYPCTYEWDEERFPDPKSFTDKLLSQNIRLNLWENLFVSEKSELFENILPYCGSHKVWNGVSPDFTLEKTQKLYSEKHEKEHVSIGVSGYKIDECDGFDGWLFPDHAKFPSKNSAATVRNTLGIIAQKTLDSLYREKKRRTYGLVRASNAGSSQMPFCIYNDCYAFDEYMTGLASSSFCGCLWVPELRDAETPNEWVRRFQMSLFAPMLMLNAWANGVKPWLFEEVSDIIRNIICQRKQLLPYIYNAFYTYREKGIPPFRALCLDFSSTGGAKMTELDHTKNPYQSLSLFDITDQYMAGDCVLVCPVRPNQTKRRVTLPPCDWFDYYTGEFVGNGCVIEVDCPLEKIPLYVKSGGMIPHLINGEIIVRCYGEKGESFIYDDDGETFDCEKGAYTLFKISFEKVDGIVKGKSEKIYEKDFVSDYKIVKFE